MSNSEYPLSLQLHHGPHQSAMELRLVQVRESRSAVPMASGRRKSKVRDPGSDSEGSGGSDSSPNIMPKEEGIDCMMQAKLAQIYCMCNLAAKMVTAYTVYSSMHATQL